MSGRLEGMHCLVTGAGQGIGLAITRAFLREGARVIAADLQEELLHSEFGDDDRVLGVRLDVTDAEAVTALGRNHPEVEVLVNCAGWVANGSILESASGDLARSMAVNVFSIENTVRAFLPAMRERRAGSIINIASVVSSVMAAPNRFAYGTSKAAVIGLTLSVARDYVAEGIRCNAISPGTVDSPSLAERLRASGDEAAARAAFVARQPMGRLGTPEEIAEVAVLLASNEAPFMTGSNIVIDGGMSL